MYGIMCAFGHTAGLFDSFMFNQSEIIQLCRSSKIRKTFDCL